MRAFMMKPKLPGVAIVLVVFCVLETRLICKAPAAQNSPANAPTFYRDVLPILQQHCQSCHRPGEIAPMPLLTYGQARAWAGPIRGAICNKTMPPWFADPHYGRFSNDPSLTEEEIQTISNWVG